MFYIVPIFTMFYILPILQLHHLDKPQITWSEMQKYTFLDSSLLNYHRNVVFEINAVK